MSTRLFERGQFGAVTTEFGVVLTQHAKLILAEARKARLEIDGLREEHRGEGAYWRNTSHRHDANESNYMIHVGISYTPARSAWFISAK